MRYAERRRHERVTVDIYVHWGWTEDCPYTDRIISISAGGCFIRTPREGAERGQAVFVRLWLPAEKTLGGEVRYTLELMGFGLQFKGLTEDDSAALENLLEHYRRLGA
ncbi:MAG TPA: PilZ domain-containing protein [Pyrinomonadaceae bacterium]|nr:PilZ domain-containing protein [Pyrinomonadaceae bacterium]